VFLPDINIRICG